MRSSALIFTTTLLGGAQTQNILPGAGYNNTCETWNVTPDAATTKLIMSAKCSFNDGSVCSQLDLTPCFKEQDGRLIAYEGNTFPQPLDNRNLPQDHAHPNEAWEDFLQDGIDDSFTVEPADPNGAAASAADRDEGEGPAVYNSTSTVASAVKVKERKLKQRRRAIVRQEMPRESIQHWFPNPVHAASFMTKLGPGDSYTGKLDTRMSYQSNGRDNNQLPGGYKGNYIEMANIIGTQNGILYCPGAPGVTGVATNC